MRSTRQRLFGASFWGVACLLLSSATFSFAGAETTVVLPRGLTADSSSVPSTTTNNTISTADHDQAAATNAATVHPKEDGETPVHASIHASSNTHEREGDGGGHGGAHPAHAVLFAPFSVTLGVGVFFLLSRYCSALPYTAVMFLLGTVMGVGVVVVGGQDHVSESLYLWINIDSEVLLLVFLPGLLFKDAHGLNVHLFRVALPQCLLFAFPLVLAGTGATACIAYYVFPYGWSFDLAMCFGAILSATDPVAVAALLEEVGAPPRLKVHVAGEALLNDGAAIVFFFIFLYRYLWELGLDGGEDVGWGRGFELFFRMSLGGVAIGLAFGVALVTVLRLLNRRYNREDSVVQVAATMSVAYTGYYVAEVVCHTSGVIATVTCGIIVKYFGRSMINDTLLLDDFWTLVEHLLNTVLFVLGGVVWGSVIAEGERDQIWTSVDWGYLVLLYVLLTMLRGALFALAFPITSRIGLQTNWYETIFQVYGGLRGAVGIALAIALDNSVTKNVPAGSIYAEQTAHLFAMVGGMAFLTLVINGSTAGPLLIKMGLSDSTNTRKKIVDAYQAGFKRQAIHDMVKLLSKRLFRNVNFALVKHHVPYLSDLTREQLCEAIIHQRDSTPEEDYKPPYLDRILPYLPHDDALSESFSKYCFVDKGSGEMCSGNADTILANLDPEADYKKRQRIRSKRARKMRGKQTLGRRMSVKNLMKGDLMSAAEFRQLFISILKSAYQQQVQRGELIASDFLFITLDESLEFASEACARDKPLMDWKFANILHRPSDFLAGEDSSDRMSCCVSFYSRMVGGKTKETIDFQLNQFEISRAISFISAHRFAQTFFLHEFENADSELTEGGKIVLEESEAQIDEAELALAMFEPAVVEQVVSHMFCTILLNSGVHYITKLVHHGLLKEQEAEHLVHAIQIHLDGVISCREDDHPETHEHDRRATILNNRESIVQMTSKNALLMPMDVLQEGMSDYSASSLDENPEAPMTTTAETQVGDDRQV